MPFFRACTNQFFETHAQNSLSLSLSLSAILLCRYILVDWLVEVADLKQFSRDTLYMTVGLVDLFLAKQVVLRKSLQLLGIACMVIAARFSEAEVITIREAAWLTVREQADPLPLCIVP